MEQYFDEAQLAEGNDQPHPALSEMAHIDESFENALFTLAVTDVRSIPQAEPASARVDDSQADRLVSFEEFRANHLISAKGQLIAAPWNAPGFLGQLRGLLSESLHSQNLPHLRIAVRAAEDLDDPCLLDSDLLQQAVHFLRTGQALAQETFGTTWARWRATLLTAPAVAEDATIVGSGLTGLKLLAFVHAFASSDPVDLSNVAGGEADLGFESADLEAAFLLFHQRSLTTQGWADHLRERLGNIDPIHRREHLEERIAQAKNSLRALFQERQSLPTLSTSFCKDAWKNFIKRIGKDRADLLTEAPAAWKSAPSAEKVRQWSTLYEREMASAKYIDRARMNRVFDDLSRHSITLAGLIEQWKSSAMTHPQRESDQAAIGPLKQLLEGGPLADGEEELCRRITAAVLCERLVPEKTYDLPLSELIIRPALLEFTGEMPEPECDAEGRRNLDAPIIVTEDLAQARRLAARLLEGAGPLPEPDADLLSFVRDSLERRARADLEDRLTAWMDESDRRRLWSQRRQQIEDLQQEALTLSQLALKLSDLIDPRADDVRGYADHLRAISERLVRVGFELPLVQAWSRQIAQASRGLIEWHLQHLRERFAGDLAMLDAIEREDYAAATVPAHHDGETVPKLRETLFRPAAEKFFADPVAIIKEIAERPLRNVAPSEERAIALAASWDPSKLRHENSAKKLRSKFLEFVFQIKCANSPLYNCVTTKHGRAVLECAKLCEALDDDDVNPSYLPQIARIGNVQVLTPELVTVSTILNPIKTLGNDLFIVLVPRVTPKVIAEVRQAARAKLIAVIDDLNLCRLLALRTSTDVAPLLGLLEIALEQQRWEQVDPYETQDGQHVRKEMFVGRADEASKLALTNNYKKLFSGRKLGKSALLRHVKDRYDNHSLPSKNTLRVVYLTIVENFEEHDFVRCVIAGIQQACSNWRPPLSAGKAGDRLLEAVNHFLEFEPKCSLLIVLDEADKFVESELEMYLKKTEGSLSFRLRSEIEALTDRNGFPRVRFLFAGYRQTNRSEGAWSNWGSTLRLSPLGMKDATALLAGPLARVGIDLGDLAGILAYRCGRQPAVLLRAGKALLTRLARQRPLDQWEYMKVPRAEGMAVLESQEIRDEIKQVINNNFTQNKLGQVVFYAAVFLLSEGPFGHELEDPAEALMCVLAERGSNAELISWMKQDERSARAQIEEQLKELVERELLVAEGNGPVRYRLMFPHHVSALGGRQQLITRLEQDIDDLPGITFKPERRGALSFFAADEIRTFRKELDDFKAGQERLVRALIAAGHWLLPSEQNPVLHPSCGIKAQLGSEEQPPLISAGEASAAVQGSHRLPLLAGGADLLRWSLEQPREEFLDEYACIRRLTRDDLAAWFRHLYEIEIANHQLDRMYEMTSGIPHLVGALHRILLPEGKARPEKLEQSSWQRVQEKFAEDLPSLSRQLRQGDPDVRLTKREIEILEMVSAAQSATVDQLARDLTNDWAEYNRPEILPLDERDEPAVELLQNLGLLPMRRDSGLGPIQSLLPLEASDALHIMLRHLNS